MRQGWIKVDLSGDVVLLAATGCFVHVINFKRSLSRQLVKNCNLGEYCAWLKSKDFFLSDFLR